MPRTPRPLTSALAAALAAGTVVAVSAVADPGSERPARAAATKGWRVAPPPTRNEAIRDASAARDELERSLAKKLGLEPGKVREAQRTIVARRLAEEVGAERLTPAQRDALLACFDDPLGCDRGALPTSRLSGGTQVAYAQVPPVVELVRPPLPLPAVRPATRGRNVAPATLRSRKRQLDRIRRAQERRRRAQRVPRPLLVSPPDAELARALGVDAEALTQALRETLRGGAARPPRLDPDGVPLGLPSLPYPLVVPAAPPAMVTPPAPAPRPRIVRPRATVPGPRPTVPTVPVEPAPARPGP